MKKLQYTILSGLIACSLCACGQQTNNSNNNQSTQNENSTTSTTEPEIQKNSVAYHTPEAIKNRGELVVGVRGGSYEFFKDKDGKEVGYEVDLANAIAKDIGENVKVKYVESSVENMLNSLAAGDIDIALASLESSSELKERFTLSKSYWPWETGYASVFILNTNKEKYNNLNELSKNKIAVVKGTLQEELVEIYAPEAERIVCENINECVTKLIAGEAGAIAADDSDMSETLSNKSEVIKSSVTIPESPEDQGLFIAMMKGASELQGSINKTISTRRESGELESWISKAWADSIKLISDSEVSETQQEENK